MYTYLHSSAVESCSERGEGALHRVCESETHCQVAQYVTGKYNVIEVHSMAVVSLY